MGNIKNKIGWRIFLINPHFKIIKKNFYKENFMNIIPEFQKKLESLTKQIEENKEQIENIIKENRQINYKEIYLNQLTNLNFLKSQTNITYHHELIGKQFLLTKELFDAQNKLFNDIEILSSNYSKILEIYEKITNLQQENYNNQQDYMIKKENEDLFEMRMRMTLGEQHD